MMWAVNFVKQGEKWSRLSLRQRQRLDGLVGDGLEGTPQMKAAEWPRQRWGGQATAVPQRRVKALLTHPQISLQCNIPG